MGFYLLSPLAISSLQSILTTLTRDIESESLLRMRPSVMRCTIYPDTDLRKLPLLFLGNRNSATPDTKNH